MKYAVVTGSSGGIGSCLVEKLLKKDIFVFGIDIKDNGLKNNNFKFIKCDLTKDEEISNIVNLINKETSHIDIIYNISGIFLMQSMIEGKEENLRKAIELNFFATYKITRTLFPLLSCGSKIVIFSSEVARYSPHPFDGYYCLSKVLVDKYGDVLRRELNYQRIKVIKVQCGAVKTNLLTGVNESYNEMVENSRLYKKPLTKLKSLMDDEINKQRSPEKVSNLLVKIADKKHPKILYKSGNSFKLRFLALLPEKLQDRIYLKVIK